MGHVRGTTWDQKMVQDASDSTGCCQLRLRPDADASLEMKNGTSSMAPGCPARARTNFFIAQVKLARGPIPRRAFGVIGRVLLLSFANVLGLPFATRQLLEFCSA